MRLPRHAGAARAFLWALKFARGERRIPCCRDPAQADARAHAKASGAQPVRHVTWEQMWRDALRKLQGGDQRAPQLH